MVLSYASLFIIKKLDGAPIRTLDSLVPTFDFSDTKTTVSDSVNFVVAVISSISDEAVKVGSASTPVSSMEVEIHAREIIAGRMNRVSGITPIHPCLVWMLKSWPYRHPQ